MKHFDFDYPVGKIVPCFDIDCNFCQYFDRDSVSCKFGGFLYNSTC